MVKSVRVGKHPSRTIGDRRMTSGVGVGLASWRPWATADKVEVEDEDAAARLAQVAPIVVSMPLKVMSLNELLRVHRFAHRRLRRQWERALIAFSGRRFAGPFTRIEIASYRKQLLDYDNLVGGCKLLLDAIRALEWIEDDDPDAIKVDYRQVKAKEESTQVRLW